MPSPTTTEPRNGEYWWVTIGDRKPEVAQFSKIPNTPHLGRWYPCGDEQGWKVDPSEPEFIKPLQRVRYRRRA